MKKIILFFIISGLVCMYSISVSAMSEFQQINSSSNKTTPEIIQNNEATFFPNKGF